MYLYFQNRFILLLAFEEKTPRNKTSREPVFQDLDTKEYQGLDETKTTNCHRPCVCLAVQKFGIIEYHEKNLIKWTEHFGQTCPVSSRKNMLSVQII